VVSNVRQTAIHTAEPLVPERNAFLVEMAIAKIKGSKSPGINQIPTELIKAVGRKIRYEIHKIETSDLIRRNCLRSGRSRSLCYL
jgi:hypothetical protein